MVSADSAPQTTQWSKTGHTRAFSRTISRWSHTHTHDAFAAPRERSLAVRGRRPGSSHFAWRRDSCRRACSQSLRGQRLMLWLTPCWSCHETSPQTKSRRSKALLSLRRCTKARLQSLSPCPTWKRKAKPRLHPGRSNGLVCSQDLLLEYEVKYNCRRQGTTQQLEEGWVYRLVAYGKAAISLCVE